MNATTTSRTREAFQFHHANAGYCVGQRAEGALSMARAELEVAAMLATGFARFEWGFEENPGEFTRDCDAMPQSWHDADHEVTYCLLRFGGEVVASLGGIIDADAKYRRVVEAELAIEGLALQRSRDRNMIEGVLAINALS